jgi:hypothetical protein
MDFTFIGADLNAIHTSKMLNIKAEKTMNIDKASVAWPMK